MADELTYMQYRRWAALTESHVLRVYNGLPDWWQVDEWGDFLRLAETHRLGSPEQSRPLLRGKKTTRTGRAVL